MTILTIDKKKFEGKVGKICFEIMKGGRFKYP